MRMKTTFVCREINGVSTLVIPMGNIAYIMTNCTEKPEREKAGSMIVLKSGERLFVDWNPSHEEVRRDAVAMNWGADE